MSGILGIVVLVVLFWMVSDWTGRLLGKRFPLPAAEEGGRDGRSRERPARTETGASPAIDKRKPDDAASLLHVELQRDLVEGRRLPVAPVFDVEPTFEPEDDPAEFANLHYEETRSTD